MKTAISTVSIKSTLALTLTLACAGSILCISGCNAVQGAGQDLKDVGAAGERAIDDVGSKK